MAGPTVNQQAKPSVPSVIQQHMATVIFCQTSLQPHSRIAGSNDSSYVNSMIQTVMEFLCACSSNTEYSETDSASGFVRRGDRSIPFGYLVTDRLLPL